MRIAICDDEEAQRALIIKYLQKWATLRGHNVETSSFSIRRFIYRIVWRPAGSVRISWCLTKDRWCSEEVMRN